LHAEKTGLVSLMNVENIRAVILADGVDMGRCPIGSRLPRAFWPAGDRTILENLIEQLAGQGIRRFTVCSTHGSGFAEEMSRSGAAGSAVLGAEGITLEYTEHEMPRGMGGIIRDAAGEGDEMLLALNCNIISAPDVAGMLNSNITSEADMTIGFSRSREGDSLALDASQVFLCRRSVLEHIPDVGYCDIKEGLIPQLVAAGRKIGAFTLPTSLGAFRSWREYLRAVLCSVEARQTSDTETAPKNSAEQCGPGSRKAETAEISPGARLIGAVQVCSGAKIREDAVVVGPAAVGPDVYIGRGAVISESVIWKGSRVAENCIVAGSLVTSGVSISAGNIVEGRLLRPGHPLAGAIDRTVKRATGTIRRLNLRLKSGAAGVFALLSGGAGKGRPVKALFVWFAVAVLVACLLGGYWEPTIKNLWRIWMRSDEFSSGLLVPFLAGYVLWSRRKGLAGIRIQPCILGGLALFMLAQGMRLAGLWLMYSSAERISLVLTVIAIVVLLLGWRLAWRIWAVLLYLFFMLPLPNRVQLWITQPLQQVATKSAVFGLEMLGYDVIREGNVINLNGTLVAVAEACNGLRMLTAFFVICGLVALLMRRKWWEKLVILVSSVPIAFMCNTLRLTITAIAFTMLDTEQWEKAFHDFGGLAMMPLALGLIVLELWLLSNLIVEPQAEVRAEVVTRRR